MTTLLTVMEIEMIFYFRPVLVFFKRLWSPGIDSKERIPPAYVAWWAQNINFKHFLSADAHLEIAQDYDQVQVRKIKNAAEA
jgi:hypothetical protein